MNQLGDRRTSIRLEVVGTLWGAFELTDKARVLNISDTGALVAAPVAPALGSLQPVQLKIGGKEVTVDAHVRHLKQRAGQGGVAEYLIGLEFVSKEPVGPRRI